MFSYFSKRHNKLIFGLTKFHSTKYKSKSVIIFCVWCLFTLGHMGTAFVHCSFRGMKQVNKWNFTWLIFSVSQFGNEKQQEEWGQSVYPRNDPEEGIQTEVGFLFVCLFVCLYFCLASLLDTDLALSGLARTRWVQEGATTTMSRCRRVKMTMIIITMIMLMVVDNYNDDNKGSHPQKNLFCLGHCPKERGDPF